MINQFHKNQKQIKNKMKKSILLSIALLFVVTISKAQTAMQFHTLDCNGNMHDLFADLDAGKAVLLHFYMPSCGSCPPPAQKIQQMANHINAAHPGSVIGYSFPYVNTSPCSYSTTWVTNNGLGNLYTPMDSGATQVAYYGGMGMPTVVLLGGGTNHRIMFSTLSFSTGDTLLMRDSILNMIFAATGIKPSDNKISGINLFPNPAANVVTVELNVVQKANVKIEVVNLLGEVVTNVYENANAVGELKKEVNTSSFTNGIYFMRITTDGKSQNLKFSVIN